MIKLFVVCTLVFFLFYFGIDGFRRLTKKDRWALTKTASYATLCLVLSMITLALVVLIF